MERYHDAAPENPPHDPRDRHHRPLRPSRRAFLAASTGLLLSGALAACGAQAPPAPAPAAPASTGSGNPPPAASPAAASASSPAAPPTPAASPAAAPAAPATSPAAVRSGGPTRTTDTIVVAMEAEPPNLDPAQYSGLHNARVLRQMFEGLTRTKPDSTQFEPALAKSWEVSADGTVYTFKLQAGVKFHDGTPFNAQAAKFSLDRPLNPEHPFNKVGNWTFVTSNFAMIKQVDAVDDLTLRITLQYPYAPFLARLTDISGYFVSPRAVEQYGADIVTHPVGTGRYRFESWERGSRIVLKRNEDYWGDPGRAESLVFRWSVENQPRLTELLTGSADIILPVPPDGLAQLQADPNVTLLRGEGIHFWYVGINGKTKPFDDRRVRQAMAYAIDKEVIVRDILRDTAIVADGPINPGTWGKDPNEKQYRYDPERARALLREAGVPDGFSFPFWVPESGSGMQSPVDMATVIQSQWARVGLNPQIQTFEWAAFLGKLRGGEQTVFVNSWLAGNEDPDFIFYSLYHSKNAPFPNRAFYANPEVDAALDEARRVTDQGRRAELYRKVQQLIGEDLPYIPVDHDVQIVATRRNIKGLQLHPGYELRLETATKD